MSERRSNTEPLHANKNREEPFWKLIRQTQSQLISIRNSRKKNNYHKRPYRKRPSYRLYGINHHQFNKYGFNVLDFCDFKGIPYHKSGADTYDIDSNGNGHGDFSSLKVSQVPDAKRVSNGAGGTMRVRANNGKTYSLLNRFATKNVGLRGLDSVTQFIMNYEGWDDNPSPRTIKLAKRERNRFFKEYAKAGFRATAHPAKDAGVIHNNRIQNSNNKVFKDTSHHNQSIASQLKDSARKQDPYKKQIKYNRNVHFEDEATKSLKTTFLTTLKDPKTIKDYARQTGENSKQAKNELTSYNKILKSTSKFMHDSHLPYKNALNESILNATNNVKAYKKHLPLIKSIRKKALQHASKYVNEKSVNNSIAMDYLHNKRGLPKSEVNYFINRGLIRGLNGYQFYSKKAKKTIKVDPRLEFLWRIPKNPTDAHTNNQASDKHQPISADAGLSKGIHNGKLAGASYIYLLPKHVKNSKTGRMETHYDKDHAAFGNSKKVDNNSIKNYGFNFHMGNGKSKLCTFEAPIDALSFLYLNRNNQKIIKNSTFLALDGADSKSKTIQAFINAQFPQKDEFNHIILAPDNDIAGGNLIQDMGSEFGNAKNYVSHRKHNQKLVSAMVPVSDNGSVDRTYALQKKAGIKVNGKTSPFNKDWNEMLQKATFDGVKFPKNGQPMSMEQYGQHTINQFMKSLPTVADKKRFVGFTDAVDKMNNSNELININNPKVKVLESALKGMSSKSTALASKLHVSPKIAKKELSLYQSMTNRNSRQQNNILKSKPKYLRDAFNKNHKAIMMFSIPQYKHGVLFNSNKYAKEKFNKFMGTAGNFMSPADMKRDANQAYQKEFGKPYHISKPVARALSKPFNKSINQIEVERGLKQMQPRSAKLFVTANRLKALNNERFRYVRKHPRTFQTTKNIYGAQIDINLITRKAIFNKLKHSNSKDMKTMGKLTKFLRGRYNENYCDVVNHCSKQYMYSHNISAYRPLNIVKNPAQRNKIQHFRKVITRNNKVAFKNYRNYMIRRYHKDPARKYSKKYRRQSKQASKANMSTKDAQTYGKVAQLAHHLLIDTKAGNKALKYLHKHYYDDNKIKNNDIGYIPSGGIGKTIIESSLVNIKGQTPDLTRLNIFDKNNQNRLGGKLIVPKQNPKDKSIAYGLTGVNLKTGEKVSAKPMNNRKRQPYRYRNNNRWHRLNNNHYNRPKYHRWHRPYKNNNRYSQNRNQHQTQSPLSKRQPHKSFINYISDSDVHHAVNLIDNFAKSKLSTNIKNKNLYYTKSINDFRQMSGNGRKIISGVGISRIPAKKLKAFVNIYRKHHTNSQSMNNNQNRNSQKQPSNKEKIKLINQKKIAMKRNSRGDRS